MPNNGTGGPYESPTWDRLREAIRAQSRNPEVEQEIADLFASAALRRARMADADTTTEQQ